MGQGYWKRRIFYDVGTGEIKLVTQASGDILDPAEYTAEREAADLELDMANMGVMEWTEPDEAVEGNFATGRLLSVDVTQDPPALVFDFTPVEPPPVEDTPTYDELRQANDILMGKEI